MRKTLSYLVEQGGRHTLSPGRNIGGGAHMNIEEYGFERSDLVVVTAVNAYLKNLTPEARREILSEIVKQDGVIDGSALAALIENAKAAAMISLEEWQPGEGDYQRALSFIQEQLPAADGEKYVKKIPEKFLQFIADCAAEA